MGKTLIMILMLALIIILVGCKQAETEDGSMSITIIDDTPSVDVVQEEASSGYTLSDVAMHSTKDDCWLLIDGRIYDVTGFIGGHPGGEAILQGCGTDATALFETRPMGSGKPHSDNARNLLESYYIGGLG